MSGLTDLAEMLATLTASRRPGRFAVLGPLDDGARPDPGDGVEALVREGEGWTAIVDLDRWGDGQADGDRDGNAAAGPVFAWLTLDVHSSLEAVGLTAAVARALAAVDIPANVVAAALHDHLLVPEHRAEQAIAAIEALRTR